MDRLACVDLPAFPLQLLLKRHPEWRPFPVAVVADDKPQGEILWVNEKARASRILPGQRYAHALSLAHDLRAGLVAETDITAGVAAVVERLRAFSPDVDPPAGEPGVFWLDASGLHRLYDSLRTWAAEIRADLAQASFVSTIVVGFSRFGTYAIARARRKGIEVFEREPDERAAACAVPLERLDIHPKLRDALLRLGVSTVGGFVRLPAGGILQRFGDQAHRLHALASGEQWDPLRPAAARESAEQHLLLDDPERDSTRLLFVIKRALHPLLALLAKRQRALAALYIELRMDRVAERRLDTIRPSEPTLDARSLLRLVHLRLESCPPRAGVIEVELGADDVPATREQLSLFAQKPRRDLRAANEAFARLRAELGNDTIVKATVREGHLPEARFSWEPLAEATLPNPTARNRVLVRRVYARPRALPPQTSQVRDDGWLLNGLEHGAVVRVVGPYVVSGGWWMNEVHREYHFAETRRGELLWVYYDRKRRRWYLHGQVG